MVIWDMNLFSRRQAKPRSLATTTTEERAINKTLIQFRDAKRIVVKVGTELVSREGTLNYRYMWMLTGVLAKLAKEGKQVVLVTSGAVSAGKRAISPPPLKKLDETTLKQLYAGFGKRLYDAYSTMFRAHGITFAYDLLSPARLSDQDVKNHNTFIENAFQSKGRTLFGRYSLPVVLGYNQHDVEVPKAELPHVEKGKRVFPDNAPLASSIATEIAKADALLYLSKAGGVYTQHPGDPQARLVQIMGKKIPKITWGAASREGTGSMESTHNSAMHAAGHGVPTAIIGGAPITILNLFRGNRVHGTYYPRRKTA